MNSEEMRDQNKNISMAHKVQIEQWSDTILSVRLIDGVPFVCDQHGLPIIGQKDTKLESTATGLTTFTASFRQYNPE